ncbi:MAG TPA: SDR family oxidoreductase [Acetobacteraceae bacterium]|nr:SDR family oxidoreductase [Acetobacteraceae bacterium]
MELEGRALLVTGGSRGVGRAIALQAARGGADVALIYRSSSREAEAVVAEIRGLGRKAFAVAADLADSAAVAAAVDAAAVALGRLDLLALAAGAMGQWATVAELSSEDWDRYIAVDLSGSFYALHAAIPHLRAAGGGAIVAISSIATQMVQPRNVQGAAAKAGVEAMIRVVAREEARKGIRANALAIGLTDTEMAQVAFDRWGPETTRRIVEGIPLRRIGTAEEVADVACLMLGPRFAYLTGKVIQLDGGQIIAG